MDKNELVTIKDLKTRNRYILKRTTNPNIINFLEEDYQKLCKMENESDIELEEKLKLEIDLDFSLKELEGI